MPLKLATWEAELVGIIVQGQPRQKVFKRPSQPMAGAYLSPLATWGRTNRRSWSRLAGNKERPYSKNT
jgi:hypothetical protein